MKVYCCYLNLFPETKQALEAHWPAAEFRHTPGPYGYWEVLNEIWTAGESFIVVEQDIVIREDTIQNLASCPQRWCGYLYNLSYGYEANLGCTKFDRSLMRDFPGLFAEVAETQNIQLGGKPGRHWTYMDSAIAVALGKKSIQICEHEPPLRNLSPRQQPSYKGIQ